MKRLLLTLVCCSPLLFSPSTSLSLDLIGPNGEQAVSYEQYGPISAVETLWGIATKLRSANSVSIQQTLVAIYKINPYAFYKGNINQLIPESIIKVPSLEFIQAQTDQEAAALIRKYSTPKQAKVAAPKPQPVAPVKEQLPENPIPETVAAEVPVQEAENLVDKKEFIALENELARLRNDFDIVNEQLLVVTENNQSLKLKLQPLNDQISALKEQIASELLINAKLQNTVDDYRLQLDAVKARPFSGEGLLNEILRWVTSSLTNLLIVLISPVLFLLVIFAVMTRLRSKRLLADQEQELAESTASLMEEAGQFDSLLTDDIAEEPEVDFTSDLSVADTMAQVEEINESLSFPEESEGIDLTDTDLTVNNVVDIPRAEETLPIDEDDPFGIAALSEEELISSVDLDDAELQTATDEPLGFDALSEDELISSVDLDDAELQTSKDDPFGIAALTEEEDLTANVDLDLLAEWESELAEPAGEEQGKQNDLAAADAFSIDSPAPSTADGTADFNENSKKTAAQEYSISDLEITDTDAIDLSTETEYTEFAIDHAEIDLADAESDDFELADLDALQESALTEATASTIVELEENEQFDALLAEPIGENAEYDSEELLAKQLSDTAFSADTELPKVDSAQENKFIDIETLLVNSDEDANDEPYSELDLDLGLDEFPDVINTEDNIDIDDDENGVAAQLDLARAYLEIDDKAGAKQILLSVVADSDGAQRVEIDKLLSRLA